MKKTVLFFILCTISFSLFAAEKKAKIDHAIEVMKSVYIGKRKEVEEYLASIGFNELKGGVLAFELLKRQGVEFDIIKNFIPELKDIEYDNSTVEEIEVIAKYEGYIVKQIKEAENMRKIEEMKIPASLDYLNMDGLALEARQKLNKVQPLTIGQASRISGVNPSDISILILNVRKYYEHD